MLVFLSLEFLLEGPRAFVGQVGETVSSSPFGLFAAAFVALFGFFADGLESFLLFFVESVHCLLLGLGCGLHCLGVFD